MKITANKYSASVIVFCFMPNHLHLLLEATEEGNIKEMMRIFKQRTAFIYKQSTGNKLWQASYYDRVLRQDEETIVVARYIMANPVRAKIVEEAIDYPFTGSFVYTKEELCC